MTDKAKKLAILYRKINRLPVLSDEEVQMIKDLIEGELEKRQGRCGGRNMTNLKEKKIIYTFDTWEDYDDLMQYLEDEGVLWASGNNPTAKDEMYGENLDPKERAIRRDYEYITRASRQFYNNPTYKEYKKLHWKKKEDITPANFLDSEEHT